MQITAQAVWIYLLSGRNSDCNAGESSNVDSLMCSTAGRHFINIRVRVLPNENDQYLCGSCNHEFGE